MELPYLRAGLRREYFGLVEVDQPHVLRERHVPLHLEEPGTQFKDVARLERQLEFWPKIIRVEDLYNKVAIADLFYRISVRLCEMYIVSLTSDHRYKFALLGVKIMQGEVDFKPNRVSSLVGIPMM